MLVAFRIVQAAGAALLTPTSLSLVLATTAPERRQGAVRAWTAVGGLAAALGPVVGGLLVAASWRWVFYVNVPIGLAAIVIGWRRLPQVPGHPVPRPDALGALLVTAGVGALTLGLVKGNDWGWGSAPTVVALAVRRRGAGPVRAALRARPQSADRRRAVPHSSVHAAPAVVAHRVLDRVRRDAAVDRALVTSTSGDGRRCRPAWASLRAR